MAVLTAKVLLALKADLEGRADESQLAEAVRQFANQQPHATMLMMGAGLMLGPQPDAAQRVLGPGAYLCLALRAAGRPPSCLLDPQLQAASRAVCGPLLEALESTTGLHDALKQALPPPGVREHEPEAFMAVVGQSMALAGECNIPGPEAVLLMAVHATVAWALLASAGLVERPWDQPEELPDVGLGDLADGVGADWPWDDPEATVQSLESLGFHALRGGNLGGMA